MTSELEIVMPRFMRGIRDKPGIAELGVDLGDLAFELADFLGETRRLRRHVNQTRERQNERCFIKHDLHRALRHDIGHIRRFKPRQPHDGIAVWPGQAGP